MVKDDLYKKSKGGGLKLKGGLPDNSKKSKKRKEDKSTKEEGSANPPRVEEVTEQEVDEIAGILGPNADRLTEIQRKHILVQYYRMQEQAQAGRKKTYRGRVEELNKHLASLSDHFDIPKVGPG
eukprot:GHVH01005648.1.p1 GENE.GHVH01005648.1~~GHVH01005648.1.p1  ORF type:complete len:139 (+),score=22.59 GHVH01005648.1:47-418(+)